MTELEQALVGDSYAAPPFQILEGLTGALVHRVLPGVPHTIYQELWHIVFWQQISLDWMRGIATPPPAHAAEGFPDQGQTDAEPWPQLHQRFFAQLEQVAAATRNPSHLARTVPCPRPDQPDRVMTVEDQLISLAAHNAYHLGRIVLLRQLQNAWPPQSGGFTW